MSLNLWRAQAQANFIQIKSKRDNMFVISLMLMNIDCQGQWSRSRWHPDDDILMMKSWWRHPDDDILMKTSWWWNPEDDILILAADGSLHACHVTLPVHCSAVLFSSVQYRTASRWIIKLLYPSSNWSIRQMVHLRCIIYEEEIKVPVNEKGIYIDCV